MIVFGDKSGNGKGVGFTSRARTYEEFEQQRAGVVLTFLKGAFNFALRGTFNAVMRLERSRDNGETWAPLTAFGSILEFNGPCEESAAEPEDGVMYRWNCVTFVSGKVISEIGQ